MLVLVSTVMMKSDFMDAIAERLSISEFDSRYGLEKPYYEFWHGEAVQKSMPDWIHGLLQVIVAELLKRAGFRVGSEVKLKIDLDLQLIPDLIATRGHIELRYPSTAVEVVIEILSEDDAMSRMLTKCRTYQNWGFHEIYVIDPSVRMVFRWTDSRLEQVVNIAGIEAREIWLALDGELQ